MDKIKMDLADRSKAEQNRNQTAITGLVLMNIILSIAYLVEVLKGVRNVWSYVVVLCLTVIPTAFMAIIYLKNKDSKAIRYIGTAGFGALYGYVMFTSSTDLVFCYVLVVLAILVVYVDMKLSLALGVYSFLINLIVVVIKYVNGEMDATGLTNSEIMIVCILLTNVFTIIATRKVDQINEANIKRAEMQRAKSEELLQTVLNIATSITENIGSASGETEYLETAISDTQRAMQELTEGTNDTVNAIVAQQQSTEAINVHIQQVERTVDSIIEEIRSAESNLEEGNVIMKDLLGQVQISEESSSLVAKEVSELKTDAGQMQDIMGLIGSVANQTGMLALNASIEAARAGEAGRGFAVVASEISNLASQTNNATGDINKLIDNVTKSVEEVTEAVEKLLESNRLQNQYVENTADNFAKIHSSTQDIMTQAGKLREAVVEVTTENSQVVERIENVSAITQEVTAGANETLESCNRNLKSIENVGAIMGKLEEDVKELQKHSTTI